MILFLWWWKRLFWVCVTFYVLLWWWCGLVFVLWFVFGFSCFVLVYRLIVYCGLILLVLLCDLVWFSYLFGWCIYVVFDLCMLNGFWLILMSLCGLGFCLILVFVTVFGCNCCNLCCFSFGFAYDWLGLIVLRLICLLL